MEESKSRDASARDPSARDPQDWRPRLSPDKLALHRWEMGQVLHPAQFRAQEAALLEHIGLRAQLAGLPSYGVALLRWNEDQLATGDLSISDLIVVLPSGLPIAYPGNAVLTTSKLTLPAKPDGPVSIYLHLRRERRPEGARGLSRSRYETDDPEVTRVVYQVEISAEPKSEDKEETVTLATLSARGKVWALDPYVPPLLRIGRGTTPFLRATLDQTVKVIARFETELVRRAADALTGAEQLSDVRRLLVAVRRVQAALADHGYGAPTQTVAMHPYHLFAALRDFYLEAVVLLGKSLDTWPVRYQHEDLRGCFEQLAGGLSQHLAVTAVATRRLAFQRQPIWFITERFPEELCLAKEVFLLLERAPQAPELDASVFDTINLASPLRCNEVYTHALEGVPRRSVPSAGIEQTFGRRATVFQLDTQSPEWQQAKTEGALCFRVRPGLEYFTASLFWHAPAHD